MSKCIKELDIDLFENAYKVALAKKLIRNNFIDKELKEVIERYINKLKIEIKNIKEDINKIQERNKHTPKLNITPFNLGEFGFEFGEEEHE